MGLPSWRNVSNDSCELGLAMVGYDQKSRGERLRCARCIRSGGLRAATTLMLYLICFWRTIHHHFNCGEVRAYVDGWPYVTVGDATYAKTDETLSFTNANTDCGSTQNTLCFSS